MTQGQSSEIMSYGEKNGPALKMAGRLSATPELQSAEAALLLSVLNMEKADPQALFVGGCVRDALLQLPVIDVDIATLHAPPVVTSLLERAGVKVIPTGIAHGTVTAVLNGKRFEVTTLRRDVETFGRHAVVAFSSDWAEDAARRDFTMNTLLADAAGNIYDPLGSGLTDLRAGRVVFVGDAATRIAEDYLRILRFFRFYGRYGRGEPDEAALKACKRFAIHIADLSRERITQEFLKILAGAQADRIVGLMLSCGVLAEAVHPAYSPPMLQSLIDLQGKIGAFDSMARLAILSGLDTHHDIVLDRWLILPGRDKTRLANCLAALDGLDPDRPATLKAAVYRFGNAVALQALLLACARDDIQIQADLIEAAKWVAPPFPLNGADLKQAGFREGPEMGRILKIAERWWIDRDFEPGRDTCLAYALKMKN